MLIVMYGFHQTEINELRFVVCGKIFSRPRIAADQNIFRFNITVDQLGRLVNVRQTFGDLFDDAKNVIFGQNLVP